MCSLPFCHISRYTHIVVLHFFSSREIFFVCPKDEKLKFLGGSLIAYEPHGVLTCHHYRLRLRASVSFLVPLSSQRRLPARSLQRNLPDLTSPKFIFLKKRTRLKYRKKSLRINPVGYRLYLPTDILMGGTELQLDLGEYYFHNFKSGSGSGSERLRRRA